MDDPSGQLKWLAALPFLLVLIWQISWQAGTHEEWRLLRHRFERHRMLDQRTLSVQQIESATFQVCEAFDGGWELRLLTESAVDTLHQSESLREVLSLAALLEERTGFVVEYPNGAVGLVRTLLDRSTVDQESDLRVLLADPQCIPLLAQVWRQAGNTIRQRIDWLFTAGDAGITVLLAALDSADAEIKASALELLGALDGDRSLPLLRQGLAARETRVRVRAVEALGRAQDVGSVPALSELLQYGGALRLATIRALGEIGDRRAVVPLCEALRSASQAADRTAREELLVALGQLGDAAAVPALCDALEDPQIALRERAAAALGRIGDAEAAPTLIRAMLAPQNPAAARAAEALALLRYRGAMGPVVEALGTAVKTGENAVRVAAAKALGTLGSSEGIDALGAALLDPLPLVRREAAVALGNVAVVGINAPLQLRAVLPQLRKMGSPISTERSEVKTACRDALQRIEERTAAIKRLPLPAEAGAPSLDTLPRVASEPEVG
jgi:HEAT repeat protein